MNLSGHILKATAPVIGNWEAVREACKARARPIRAVPSLLLPCIKSRATIQHRKGPILPLTDLESHETDLNSLREES